MELLLHLPISQTQCLALSVYAGLSTQALLGNHQTKLNIPQKKGLLELLQVIQNLQGEQWDSHPIAQIVLNQMDENEVGESS